VIIPIDTVNSFMYENFTGVKVSRNGSHYNCRCALCGDSSSSQSKRRFNLNYNNGEPIYHCFNCSDDRASGNFIKLYSLIKGVSYDEAKKEFRKFNSDSIKKSLYQTKPKKKKLDIPPVVYHNYITGDCVTIDSNVEGVVLNAYKDKLKEFIASRNTHGHRLLIAHKGRYKGRVIIPIYDVVGNILFFQGRAINKDPRKYDNPPVEKSYIILNNDNFDKNKHIVVTEGIFDALSVGNQGTTCLGASVNDEFINQIIHKTDAGVILALDNDERGIAEMEKVVKNSRFSKKLRFFLMPAKMEQYKDINMLDGKVDSIYDFVVENSHTGFDYTVNLNLRRK